MSRRFPARVLAVIALGGAAGTLVRAAVAQALPASGDAFPWDTLLVNVVGSVVVGFVVVAVLERVAPSRYARPLLATGFCGGLTTFSTFMVESDVLIKDGRTGTAALYVAASILAGLGAARLGVLAARSAWSKEDVEGLNYVDRARDTE
jgi:fluoride exporter